MAYLPLKDGNETTGGPDYNNAKYIYENKMNLTYTKVNRWTYFTVPYDPGSLLSIKFRFDSQQIDGANFSLHLFFAFGDVFPTAVYNDFILTVGENETKTILVRPPRKLNKHDKYLFLHDFWYKNSSIWKYRI